MTGHDTTELRNRIVSLWDDKLDTMDIARELQIPQYEVEAQLHIALDLRRAIIACLGRAL